MDFIKQGANALSNNQNSGAGAATGDKNNSAANTGTTGTGAQQQDYSDKGMSFLLSFFLSTPFSG